MKAKKHNDFKLWFDRLLSKSLWRQLAVLMVVLVIAFGTSYLMLLWSGAEWEEFCKKEQMSLWLLPLYLLIDSNVLSNLYMGNDGTIVHGWMLFVSSITFLFGAFIFNGAIIGIITNAIERRVENHAQGRIHYLKSGHYIIMGYDEMIHSIIKYIFEKDKDAFVLLLSATESTTVKEMLKKVFDEERMKKIIINYGHRMSKDYYHDIHPESAEEIFIVGPRSLSTHDAINVECVDSICSYLKQPEVKGHPKRITCVFEDLDTSAAFKTSEIFGEVKDLDIEFVPYNFYSGWAKQVFVKRFHKDMDNADITIEYPAVYGKGYQEDDKTALTKDDKRYVHLVFVGTTNFAVSFAMEAANVLHFPNATSVKTRITFIDRNADIEKDEFITRNRHFFEVQSYMYRDFSGGVVNISDVPSDYYKDLSGNIVRRFKPNTAASYFGQDDKYKKGKDYDFLDVEFEFIKGDVFSKEVQDEISNWAEEHNEKQYLSIFLAMSNQRQNFVMGMNMPDEVYDHDVPVFIRQDRSDNFVSNLRNADKKKDEDKLDYARVKKDGTLETKKCDARYSNIYPFGMNETAFSADENSLKRAKLINYLYSTMPSDYKFRGILALDAMSEETIWTEADKYWKNLSVAHKWSNLYSAYAMRIKLASLRAMRGLKQDDTSRDTWPLSDEEVEIMALVEHNRWNVEKLLMGYRKPHRDEDKYAYPRYGEELKKNKKRFVHHDIRPFDDLGAIKVLDCEFSRYIPWIMKMTEK